MGKYGQPFFVAKKPQKNPCKNKGLAGYYNNVNGTLRNY
jgi:hypothetical protein